jgi:iron(III) transport system ATP-binding protein
MIIGTELSKQFGASDGSRVRALDNVSFEVATGELYVLLGPSGSGKTTTLRVVAGLEDADRGSVTIADKLVFSPAQGIHIPPEQRPIAMVFQSYALWPHMDVYQNIVFPLRRGMRRVGAEEIARRVKRVTELLHLTEHLRRPVAQLSGGQQQRVALARALALEPAVLLMDEPLSNLDAKLRSQLRLEIKALTKAVGMTTLYVTHDQTEAMVMGDRIAVMAEGRILQEGEPAELYQRPRELFVAKFLGDMNFLAGRVEACAGGHAQVRTAIGPLAIVRRPNTPDTGKLVVGFRPEDAEFAGEAGENIYSARITARHYLGDAFLYDVQCGPFRFQLRRPNRERLEPGSDVLVHLPAESCVAFADGEPTQDQQLEPIETGG